MGSVSKSGRVIMSTSEKLRTYRKVTERLSKAKALFPNHEEEGAQTGRFALFHAQGSMCSEKCRVVMNEEGLGYTSCVVDLTQDPYDKHYHPDYVALRML